MPRVIWFTTSTANKSPKKNTKGCRLKMKECKPTVVLLTKSMVKKLMKPSIKDWWLKEKSKCQEKIMFLTLIQLTENKLIMRPTLK